MALIEVYDLNQEASKLANLSTRAFVSTGDDLVIAGFLLSNGGGSDRIVVRGVGPSLAPGMLPVGAVLADPTVELRDVNGTLLMSNNDWQDSQKQELIDTTLAPSNLKESALVTSLTPGNYTAVISGVGGTTGVGLAEVYNITKN